MKKFYFLFCMVALQSSVHVAQSKPAKISKILRPTFDQNQNAEVRFFEVPEPPYHGFDEWEFPRWMPAGVGKTNLANASISAPPGKPPIVYAKQVRFVPSNTAIKLFGTKDASNINGGNSSGSYTVNARGLAVGAASIIAKAPKIGEIGRMTVQVLPYKEVSVAAYLVEYISGTKPVLTEQELLGRIHGASVIWGPQTNVRFKPPSSTITFFMKKKKGSVFDDAAMDVIVKHINALGISQNYDRCVIATPHQPGEQAGKDPAFEKYIFLGDPRSEVASHELGHSFGLPHQPCDAGDIATAPDAASYNDMVMYPTTGNQRRFRRAEIMAIHAK